MTRTDAQIYKAERELKQIETRITALSEVKAELKKELSKAGFIRKRSLQKELKTVNEQLLKLSEEAIKAERTIMEEKELKQYRFENRSAYGWNY